MVCSLDRVAGTEAMAIEIIRDLATRAVRFRSLTEPFLDIDTTTPLGEAIVGILTVLGQLRVSTVRENTRRGLGQARARGRPGGRPTVMTPEHLDAAKRMRARGASLGRIAAALGAGKTTVARPSNPRPPVQPRLARDRGGRRGVQTMAGRRYWGRDRTISNPHRTSGFCRGFSSPELMAVQIRSRNHPKRIPMLYEQQTALPRWMNPSGDVTL